MINHVIGLDIGGTNCRIGCVQSDFSLCNFTIVPSKEVFSKSALEGLIELLQSYIRRNGMPRAVCIGFPAALKADRSVILQAPNVAGLDGLPAKAVLQEALGCPVFLEKDVNLLLLHDIRRLHLSGTDVIVGCYIGTGLGNAIFLHGKMLVGKNGVAGELGHIPLYEGGLCGCGNRGCAETRASGKGLELLQKRCFTNTSISDLFSRHAGTKEVDEYLDELSRPIATEVNIFDPDHLILGGGVVAMKDFPRTVLNAHILAHTRRPFPHDGLNIVYADAGQKNGVIGAGIYAFEKLSEVNEYDSTCI